MNEPIEMPTMDNLPSDVVDEIVRQWERKRRGEPDPHCPHCGEPGHTVVCNDCYREFGSG